MSLGYIDSNGRAQLSRLPVRIVRGRNCEVWAYWRTGRYTSSGFRLWPIRAPWVEQHR